MLEVLMPSMLVSKVSTVIGGALPFLFDLRGRDSGRCSDLVVRSSVLHDLP